MELVSESLKHSDLTEKIIGVFYDVYNELGHGFLESVYEQALAMALVQTGLNVERQVAVSVWFRGQQVGDFRADMVVDRNVLLELKAARTMDQAHEKQLLNYLRATDIEGGLLLNFGVRPPVSAVGLRRRKKENPRLSA